MKALTVTAVVLAALIMGCGSSKPVATVTVVPPTLRPGPPSPIGNSINFPDVPPVEGQVVTTPSGLKYVDETVGEGPMPNTGQKVTIRFTGWLTYGPSFTQGEQEATFPLGYGAQLKGIEEAVATMQAGGRRRVLMPPNLGYGAAGLGNKFLQIVPPYASLLADIQLVSIND